MAEIIPDALSWIDARKRQVIAELSTALGGAGAAPIWEAAQEMARRLIPALDPQEVARKRQLAGEAQSVMPEVAGPAQAQQAKEFTQGFGGADMSAIRGIAGALRAGGRPDLMMSHASHILGVSPEKGPAVSELYSPSLAITGQGRLKNPFFKHGESVLYIPREGAFDPGNPLSQTVLYPRDAFTKLKDEFPGYTAREWGDPVNEVARLRLQDKLEPVGPFSQGSEDLGAFDDIRPSISHQAAVLESKPIGSLAAYEKSQRGAALLSPREDAIAWGNATDPRILRDIEEARRLLRVEDEYINLDRWEDVKDLLWEAARQEGPTSPMAMELQALVRSAKRAPSDYAEVKAAGAVPITGHSFAGVIASGLEEQYQPLLAKLAEAHSKTGVPVVNTPSYASFADLFKLAESLQRQSGPYGGGR